MLVVLFPPYYWGSADVVDILNPRYIEIVCIEDYETPEKLWRKISRTQKQTVFIYTRYWPQERQVPTLKQQETQILPFLTYIVQQWNNPQYQTPEDIRSFIHFKTGRLWFRSSSSCSKA